MGKGIVLCTSKNFNFLSMIVISVVNIEMIDAILRYLISIFVDYFVLLDIIK